MYFTKIATSDNIATLRSLLDIRKAILVMLDLEKVFEFADPSIAAILAEDCVHGKVLGWVRDYLSGRTAAVSFQGHSSHTLYFEKGPPQDGIPP